MGEYESALNVFEEKIREQKLSLGDSNLDLATTYSNIGEVHYVRGEAIEAIDAYKKALQITKDSYGSAHISVASMLVTTGKIFQEIGVYELQNIIKPETELLAGIIDFHLERPACASAA